MGIGRISNFGSGGSTDGNLSRLSLSGGQQMSAMWMFYASQNKAIDKQMSDR